MFPNEPAFADFDRREAEHERYLAKLPKCSCCGEPIQEDYYYEFEDGKKICPECLNENYRRWTDDYED